MRLLTIFGPPGHGTKTVATAMAQRRGVPIVYGDLNRGFSAQPPRRHLYRWRQSRPLPFARWPTRELLRAPDARWLSLGADWAAACLPGHPWLGATRMAHFALADAALVVVDPARLTTAIEAELVEQLLTARHLGVRRVHAYVNEFDVAPELTALGMELVVATAARAGFTDCFVAAGCAARAVAANAEEGLAVLWERIDASPRRRFPPASPFATVALDDYLISGRGVVIAGRICSGSVRVGDSVTLWTRRGQRRLDTEVRSIHGFREPRSSATVGDVVGILVPEDIWRMGRGSILAASDSISFTSELELPVCWRYAAPAAAREYQVSMLGITSGALGRPTRKGLALTLRTPLPAFAGAPMCIRSDHRLVGWAALPVYPRLSARIPSSA